MIDYKDYLKQGKITGVSSFRDIQEKCFKTAEKEDTGLFELTCGAGKTLIQATLLKKEIEELNARGDHGVFVIASHRLLLNIQLVKEYARFIPEIDIDNNDIHVCYLCGVSRVLDDKGNDIANGNAHTSILELKEDIKKIKLEKKKHIIIFTTTASEKYHEESLVRLFGSIGKGIDLYIHDEAHKELNQQLAEKIMSVSKKSYFFTATPGEYLLKMFGSPLQKYTYTQAVNDGVVLPPVLYTANANMTLSGKKKDVLAGEVSAIQDCFLHLKQIEAEKGNENATLLVFLSSIEAVDNAATSLTSSLGCDIYSFASYKEIQDKDGKVYKYGKCKKNNSPVGPDGHEYGKSELLSELRNNSGAKIILNAFMLTEGIDLPSINGVLILCGKSDSSLYQAVMRGCRTAPGKDTFAIYVPVDFFGQDYYAQVKDFLIRLIEQTNAEFDFGGHVEDESTGKISEDIVRDMQQRVEDPKVRELVDDIKFRIEKEKEKWNFDQDALWLMSEFIDECKGKDATSIAFIKKKYIFGEKASEVERLGLMEQIATYGAK